MEIYWARFHDGVKSSVDKAEKIRSEWNLSVSTRVLGMAHSFHQKGAGNVEHIIIIYGTKAVFSSFEGFFHKLSLVLVRVRNNIGSSTRKVPF